MKGYCTVRIPEITYKICNNCDYLQYNHDYGLQLPEHECRLDDKVELDTLYGNVETPTNCPILKDELKNTTKMFRELGLPIYSKKDEYIRSIEMFNQIYKEKGFYFAIALLYDSGYTSKDLKEMMELTYPTK